MSLLPKWANRCVARLLVLVAGLASLNAAETIHLDLGEITTSQSAQYFDRIYPQYTIYFGCLDQTYNWTVTGYPFNQFNVFKPNPATALNKRTYFAAGSDPAVLGLTFTGPFNSTFQEKTATITGTAWLTLSGQVKDSHSFTFVVKAKIRYVAGAAGHDQIKRSQAVTASLKPGGPGAGLGRIPQPIPEDPEVDPEELNVGTYVPPWATDPQGRPYQPTGPAYTLPGGQTGTWGGGANWSQVTVPGGGSGVPGWFSSGFPGSAIVTDNDGGKWLIGGQLPAPGGGLRDGGFSNGTVTRMPDGSVRISAWGESGAGWSTDWIIPPGTNPKEIDGLPEEEESGSSDPVDPCFYVGYTDATGDPPPGTTPPEDPDPETPTPPPPGTTVQTPTLPGGTSGGGGGGGGSEGVGPIVTLPGYQPPPPAPSNPGGPGDTGETPQPGEPLPEDSQPSTDAKKMAADYLDGVAKTQTSVEKLMGWATVTQFNPGVAGDWVVNLQISGQTFGMVIPTTHAPLIRAILLFLLRVMFVVSVFRLLLS